MVEALDTTPKNSELLSYGRELLLSIVKDIAVSDEDRVREAYAGPESIDELKAQSAEPLRTPELLC